jgi:hypothetical protein
MRRIFIAWLVLVVMPLVAKAGEWVEIVDTCHCFDGTRFVQTWQNPAQQRFICGNQTNATFIIPMDYRFLAVQIVQLDANNATNATITGSGHYTVYTSQMPQANGTETDTLQALETLVNGTTPARVTISAPAKVLHIRPSGINHDYYETSVLGYHE